jgi:hypothetical protein
MGIGYTRFMRYIIGRNWQKLKILVSSGFNVSVRCSDNFSFIYVVYTLFGENILNNEEDPIAYADSGSQLYLLNISA